MQSVSVDNMRVGASVAGTVDLYRNFTIAMRGAAAELLSGISNGTKSLVAMDRDFKRLADDFEHMLAGQVGYSLREGSGNALRACEEQTRSHATDRSLAVADTLVASFTDSVVSTISAQMRADVRTAEDFVRRQLMGGRAFATTDQIATELEFKFKDKSGRQIDSADHVFREVNWSYRANFNTTLLFAASSFGIEEFEVEGGSKSGEVVSLDDYDKKSGSIFHHNSKALLRIKT